MFKIPVELRNAICNNELLIFVGAGLSFNLKNMHNQSLKGWSNLVNNILSELKSNGHDVDHLIPLVKKYEPIKVLDLLESDPSIPKKEIYRFVKDYFDLKDDNNLELHKKLYQLSRKIITTNYDTAFETAVNELRKNKAYKGKNYELTTHKDANSALLFKLHGCYEDVDSMVLFPSNYKDLYENTNKDAEHALLVLRNIVLNKSLLFVGTGMGDFQINNIFEEVKVLQGQYNQKHFILTNKPIDSSLKFLTEILITNYSEIDSVVDELLKIKNECNSDDSIKILELERQLEEANRKIIELENTSNKDDLLEREALKYFAKGVKFSLMDQPLKASEEYKTSLELKPDLYNALYNWGTDLGKLAKTKQGMEREKLYQLAFDKFRKSIYIKPDQHEAFNNWGAYLGNFAKTKEGKDADELYEQAFNKFRKAIEIKPDKHEAFNNWGGCLGDLAKTKEGKDAEKLYELAFNKFRKAIEIKPDKHEAFNNWGVYLGNFAKTKEGKDAEDLYHQAFDKFQTAIDIKPGYHNALDNWGVYLSYFAQTKSGKEAEVLYHQAINKLQIAIEYGASSYNLSCTYALKGERDNAIKYLKMTLSKNEIDVNYIERDGDWKDFLKDSEFIELLEEYKSK